MTCPGFSRDASSTNQIDQSISQINHCLLSWGMSVTCITFCVFWGPFSINRLISSFIDRSMNQSMIDRPISQSVGRSLNQPINESTNQRSINEWMKFIETTKATKRLPLEREANVALFLRTVPVTTANAASGDLSVHGHPFSSIWSNRYYFQYRKENGFELSRWVRWLRAALELQERLSLHLQ